MMDCSSWDDKDLMVQDYVEEKQQVISSSAVVSSDDDDGGSDDDSCNKNVRMVLEQWQQQRPTKTNKTPTQQKQHQQQAPAVDFKKDATPSGSNDGFLLDDIMEIDEQIGTNFLGDDIFGSGCTGGLCAPSLLLEEFEFDAPDDDMEEVTAMDLSKIEYDLMMKPPSAPPVVSGDVDGGCSPSFCPSSPTTVVMTKSFVVFGESHQVSPVEKKSTKKKSKHQDKEEKAAAAPLKKLQELMKRSELSRRSLSMTTPKTKKYYKSKKRRTSLTNAISSIETSSTQIQEILMKQQKQ